MARVTAKAVSDLFALQQLAGRRIRLRPAAPAFSQEVYRYTSEPVSSRFLSWRPHTAEEETSQFLQACSDAWEGEGERLPWVICVDGRVVGMIEAKLRGRNAGVGYVIAPEYWGKGYATEALQLVTTALFEYTSISAVWALCVTSNPASARVLEKCGYKQDKLIPRYLVTPNLGDEKQDVWSYVHYRNDSPYL